MSTVGAVTDRQERPAFVRFEKVPIEDKAASLQAGHYVAADVDFALITPPYSKDVVRIKCKTWFPSLENDVRNQRMPAEWLAHYRKAYEAWQQGQEMPLNGTAIKGWAVISPAQQEMLLRMNILTVEDLSGINDEGLKRVGMGSLELKNKATAWLSQTKDKGPLTMKVAALETENSTLRDSLASLEKQVAALRSLIPAPQAVAEPATPESMTADDILPEPEPKQIPKRR